MTKQILSMVLAGLLGWSAAAQPPQQAGDVEPVYRDRLDEHWSQEKLEDVRAENEAALDPTIRRLELGTGGFRSRSGYRPSMH